MNGFISGQITVNLTIKMQLHCLHDAQTSGPRLQRKSHNSQECDRFLFYDDAIVASSHRKCKRVNHGHLSYHKWTVLLLFNPWYRKLFLNHSCSYVYRFIKTLKLLLIGFNLEVVIWAINILGSYFMFINFYMV